jgi:hypothetical protein
LSIAIVVDAVAADFRFRFYRADTEYNRLGAVAVAEIDT